MTGSDGLSLLQRLVMLITSVASARLGMAEHLVFRFFMEVEAPERPQVTSLQVELSKDGLLGLPGPGNKIGITYRTTSNTVELQLSLVGQPERLVQPKQKHLINQSPLILCLGHQGPPLQLLFR